MKHAYCIIAHHEWELLRYLLKELDDIDNDIFLHIDKKEKKYEELKEWLSESCQYSNLHFVERRKITWGGASQIDCELRLFKEVLRTSENYLYVHLLSGEDFPLVSQRDLHAFFEENSGVEFLGYADDKFVENSRKKYSLYHIFQELCGRNKKSVFYIADYVFRKIQELFGVDRVKRYGITYKGGDNWCSLTRSAVKYLCDSEQYIKKIFKYTMCCDEFYKQTILYNSPYYKNIYCPNNRYQSNLRAIDWKRGKPYVFNIDDYDMLVSSGKLFARKLSIRNDKERELVEELIWHNKFKVSI